MIKKKNIIILIIVLTFIVGTVTFISYQYLFRENKSKDSKVEINNQINIDKDNQEDNKSEEDSDKPEQNRTLIALIFIRLYKVQRTLYNLIFFPFLVVNFTKIT